MQYLIIIQIIWQTQLTWHASEQDEAKSSQEYIGTGRDEAELYQIKNPKRALSHQTKNLVKIKKMTVDDFRARPLHSTGTKSTKVMQFLIGVEIDAYFISQLGLTKVKR